MIHNRLPDTAPRCVRRGEEPLRLRRLHSLRVSRALLFAVTTACVVSVAPRAIRAEDSIVLRLEEALGRAVAQNKELAAFEHRLKEQGGRVEQAGLLPNPSLRLTVEDAAGSGIYEGFDSAQTTLSLEWVLERAIRRRRVAAAEAGSALVLTDAEILRLEVAAETAQRFLTSLANQARLKNAAEAVSLSEDTVVAVRRRVRAGKAPNAELTRAEAELATAKLARDDVGHELAISYHRLAAQWGKVVPGFSRVVGELLRVPTPQAFEVFRERLEQNPRLARFVTEERVAQANLLLAEAKRWPTLRPSLGVRRLEATDDFALVAEINIPLPVLNRNQGRLTESRAALSRTRADAQAMRVRVQTALFEVYEELQHHLHRASTLRNEVIPRLSQALDETRSGYDSGRYSYFEWRSVQADLLKAQSELVEASTGAHRLVIALERLTGERVTGL